MKIDLLREAEAMKEELTAHRRWLHAHAETGFALPQTHAYVKDALTRMGYKPEDCGKCGIVAEIGTGRTILLRADMDALPIREETGLDFACKTGNMHACGHDLHTAMLLGAARLLKNHEAELQCRVRFLFQPAEEILQGAQDVIKHGVLDGVEGAVMVHVMVGTPLPVGTVVVSSPGVVAPAADHFTITIQGKGCHGAAPQNGVDPLIPAAHILLALQEIQTRELDLYESTVLTIGKVRGGSAGNAIADQVEMSGTLRAFNEKTVECIKQRMGAIVAGIDAAFRTRTRVVFESGCPCLQNDEVLSDGIAKILKEQFGADWVYTTKELNPEGRRSAGGSEDFAYISQKVPALMLALSAGGEYPLHHPRSIFDEDALPVGASVLATAALKYHYILT